MFGMDTVTLRATLGQLQRATRDHADWYENLIRSIVCHLPCDPDELTADAHRLCRFGQWYYGRASADLHRQSEFAAMEAEHERVHSIAARLLLDTADGRTIRRDEYDALIAVNARLRQELDSLRHEIEDILRSSDALTGAHGRAQLLPELREWRELALRGVQQCCIAFMDLDHLKEINDTHGHVVGDQVLAGAVHYVTGHLRAYDKVFRYGGDEFLVTLPGTSLPDADHLVRRICSGFELVPFVVGADGCPIHATASFGLAQLDPDASVEESIDRADKALLLAKAAGRNRTVTWNPAITTGTVLAWSDGDEIDA
jgi:diguanylate cyclase